MVDLFPPSRYLPKSLYPGYQAGRNLLRMTTNCFDSLLKTMIEKMNKSALNIETAMAARWWQDRNSLGLDETDVSMLAGTMYVPYYLSLRTFFFVSNCHICY